jgi:hypothetical protein
MMRQKCAIHIKYIFFHVCVFVMDRWRAVVNAVMNIRVLAPRS